MALPKVVAELKRIGKHINRQYNSVNYGGCAVYASVVGRNLAKCGYLVRIGVSSSWNDTDPTIDDARNNILNKNNKRASIEQWNDQEIYFGHVWVEVCVGGTWYAHDTNKTKMSDGVDPTFGWDQYDGFMTLEEITPLANSKRGWNTEFDRYQIKAIKADVARMFEKVPHCKKR